MTDTTISIPSPNFALDLMEEHLWGSAESFTALIESAQNIVELYESCVTLCVIIIDSTQGSGLWDAHAQSLREMLHLLNERGVDLINSRVPAGTPDAMLLNQFLALSLNMATAIGGNETGGFPFSLPRKAARVKRTFELIAGFLEVLIGQHVRLRELSSPSAAIVEYRLLAN